MNAFTTGLGVPAVAAALVILGESLGALGLITGTLTRIAAAGIVIIQLGAIKMAHWKFGFFMDWGGKRAGEGYEYALLAIAMAIVLVLGGGGRWSVARWLSTRRPAACAAGQAGPVAIGVSARAPHSAQEPS